MPTVKKYLREQKLFSFIMAEDWLRGGHQITIWCKALIQETICTIIFNWYKGYLLYLG